jgi:3-methyladenine DNA glycosylase AlkC
MATHRKTEKQFLLKDLLFNEVKVGQLADEIAAVYSPFRRGDFVQELVLVFPALELMERIGEICDALYKYLPSDYEKAIKIILKALPEPLDNNKSDDDFGDFIYAPYSYFVAKYGCSAKHLDVSHRALEEITKRFSCEAALRYFINAFPDETLAVVNRWAKSSEYHVRRLASESTRPSLPWAKKIVYDKKSFLPILDILHSDRTRYVTRSVANHLNDVSKFAPEEVLRRLETWQKIQKQNPSELSFITAHSLRTLIKDGDARALKLLGYSKAKVDAKLSLTKAKVKVGDQVEFVVSLANKEKFAAKILVHYVIHFKKANGTLSPKVFLAKKLKLAPGEKSIFKKSHSLKPMTTRVLHTGRHILELRVNGIKVAIENFELA